MDAKEARELANSRSKLKSNEQYQGIKKSIEGNANMGHYCTIRYRQLEDVVTAALLEEGYSIKDDSKKEGKTLIVIRW